jgi:hypothetical protein
MVAAAIIVAGVIMISAVPHLLHARHVAVTGD